MVRSPLVDDESLDVEAMAVATVTAGEPEVDGALRRIATEWARAGLRPDDLCRPWRDPAVGTLFAERPDLVDALDEIMRAATRATLAA